MNIAFTKRLTGGNKATLSFTASDWIHDNGSLYYIDFVYEVSLVLHTTNALVGLYEENAANDFDEIFPERIRVFFDSGNLDRATARVWARQVGGSMFDGKIVVVA